MSHIKQHIGFYYLVLVLILTWGFIRFALTVPDAQKYGDFDYTAFELATAGDYAQAAERFRQSGDDQQVYSLKSMSYFYSALMHYEMQDHSAALALLVTSLKENAINASPFTLLEWIAREIPLDADFHTHFNQIQQIEGIDQPRLALMLDDYIERLPDRQNMSKFINLLNEPLKSNMQQRLNFNTGNDSQ